MTGILTALNEAYQQLEDAEKIPPYGFSPEKISFLISLNKDGSIAGGKPVDIRSREKNKPFPQILIVPQPPKRASGVDSCFLWDKSSYVLGIDESKKPKRLAEEHEAFKKFHEELLKDSEDEGLKAFLLFLNRWRPADFELWPEEIKKDLPGQNIIFALESDRVSKKYLHNRAKAKDIWKASLEATDTEKMTCLVTGRKASAARLHPSIKGIWGGEGPGGSIVSFNLESFCSYGKKQGMNAPVSERAAFNYTAVLNFFLTEQVGEKYRHRLQIGDSSTVFWAAANTPTEAAKAEAVYYNISGSDQKEHDEKEINDEATDNETDFSSFAALVDTEVEVKEVQTILYKIRNGEKLKNFAPELEEGVRFYILGLAPNVARISVRFWYEDSFGHIVDHYQKFLKETELNPPANKDGQPPAFWQYLAETATQGKRKNIPPKLAGDWFYAVLTGTNYPLSLLTTVLMRIKAERKINGRRVALLKSVLLRNFKKSEKEAPVSLDRENTDKGYLLGRLFAFYEQIQYAALGDVNSSVKDKFYATASTQPMRVFPLMEKNSARHLSKLGKEKPGYKIILEKGIGQIMEHFSPGDTPFPQFFAMDEQALFTLGYYHQKQEFFKKKDEPASEASASE